jgi:hypothetical protein
MLNRRMAAFKIRVDHITYDAIRRLDALQAEIDEWGLPEPETENADYDPLLNVWNYPAYLAQQGMYATNNMHLKGLCAQQVLDGRMGFNDIGNQLGNILGGR